MDITNFIIRYKAMKRDCRKQFRMKNPVLPILICLFVILFLVFFIGILQLFETEIWFTNLAIILYALVLAALIVIIWYKNEKELSMTESYFEPLSTYKIKRLCILLLEYNLDYKNTTDIENLIYACEYQGKVRFKANRMIPSWMWNGIIGPLCMFILKKYWNSIRGAFSDVITFAYCVILLILAGILIAGMVAILKNDYYADLIHDLIQIKTFNRYYSLDDEVYREAVSFDNGNKDARRRLESIYVSLYEKG